MKKVTSLNEFNCLVQARNGLFVANRHDFYLGNALIRYGEYSETEWNLLKRFLHPGATVIEVGANIGTHTVSIGQAVGPEGRVIAVEPQRIIYQYLCANLALNGLLNVEAHHCGCGKEDGTLIVPAIDYSSSLTQNFGGVSLQKNGSGEAVHIRRIDDLVADARNVHLIKVDVEGMEAEVLKGAINTILTRRPILYVENDRLEKSEELIRLLMGLNYRLFWHTPPLYNPENFFGEKENIYGDIASFNMLCLPVEGHAETEVLQEIKDPLYHPLRPTGISPQDLAVIALEHYRAGRFSDAEELCRKVLADEPDSPEHNKNHGNVLLSLGRTEEAEQAYRRAIDLKPDYAEAHNNLGNVLRLFGRLDEAEQAFRRALELLPDSAAIYNNLGNVLMDCGRTEEAEQVYRKAVVLMPDYPEAYLNRGNSLRALGRNETAYRCYRKALELNPKYLDAHFGLGSVLEQLGRPGEAEEAYRGVLTINPDYVEAHIGLGNTLLSSMRAEEAEHAYNQALALKPDYIKAYLGLGNALLRLMRTDEAVQAYRRAVALEPDYAKACVGLGNALVISERLDEAEDAYRRALAIEPGYAEAYIGLGNVFQFLGHLPEAEEAYRASLALNPDLASGKFNISLLHLLRGRYEEGFELYEHRLDGLSQNSFSRVQAQIYQLRERKRWQGELLEGRSLLLLAEQGAGDNFMMMRYLSLLGEQNPERLTVCCDPNLERVFRSIPCVDEVVPAAAPLSADRFDFYCPVMSLPYHFRTRLDSIPNRVPYLFVPDDMRTKWRGLLSSAPGKRVGLVWAGNGLYSHDAKRSVSLDEFVALTKIEGVQLVSLQKGEGADQWRNLGWDFLDWMDMCKDFWDTAALVSELDLVVSVDTSVAHLAGALGKPVWLLNRFESEWRWMLGREDSPWYPTMKIFTQKERGNWASVTGRIAEELVGFSKS